MKHYLQSVDHLKAFVPGVSGLVLSITAHLAHLTDIFQLIALVAGIALSLAGAWNYYQIGRLNRAKRKQIENATHPVPDSAD